MKQDTTIEANKMDISITVTKKKMNIKRSMYLFVKRFLDIFISFVLGVILILPILILILLIRLDSPGPAIFKQKRMGRNGKIFTIYKFRTMRLDAPPDMASIEFHNSKEYITKIGAFLRRTSLDEVPQLINIFNGTMSIVGYRPVCLTEVELNRLRAEYGVFSMRPGLTGLAQVSGRDNVTPQKKAKLDADYVNKSGIKMDCWCLIKTVKIVFSGEGVK